MLRSAHGRVLVQDMDCFGRDVRIWEVSACRASHVVESVVKIEALVISSLLLGMGCLMDVVGRVEDGP